MVTTYMVKIKGIRRKVCSCFWPWAFFLHFWKSSPFQSSNCQNPYQIFRTKNLDLFEWVSFTNSIMLKISSWRFNLKSLVIQSVMCFAQLGHSSFFFEGFSTDSNMQLRTAFEGSRSLREIFHPFFTGNYKSKYFLGRFFKARKSQFPVRLSYQIMEILVKLQTSSVKYRFTRQT